MGHPCRHEKEPPAHVLHVLTRPEGTQALQELIFTQTRNLGIRRATVIRAPLPRHTTILDLDGVPVRVKHGPHGAKPEHDDLAAAAALGIPLRAAAERAARALNSQENAS